MKSYFIFWKELHGLLDLEQRTLEFRLELYLREEPQSTTRMMKTVEKSFRDGDS